MRVLSVVVVVNVERAESLVSEYADCMIGFVSHKSAVSEVETYGERVGIQLVVVVAEILSEGANVRYELRLPSQPHIFSSAIFVP